MQVNTVMVLSQPAPSARHYTNDRLLVRVKRVGTVLPMHREKFITRL